MTSAIREDRIRSLARQLWLTEGSPVGRDKEHWLLAEALVNLEDGAPGAAARLMEMAVGQQPPVKGAIEALVRSPRPRPGPAFARNAARPDEIR
jgi:hypothetical protein